MARSAAVRLRHRAGVRNTMAQPDQPNPELSQPPGAPGTPRKLCTKLSLPAWVVDEASAGLGGSTRTQFGQEVVLRMEVVTNTQ